MIPFECFSLPEALTRVILVEWLKLKHVVRLDSAFCCRESRVRFASVAYGQTTTFAVNFCWPKMLVEPLLRWAVLKGARLDGVHICAGTTFTEGSLCLLEKFLRSSGLAIRRVRSSSDSVSTANSAVYRKALLLVAKWCPNVVSFCGECVPTSSPVGEWLVALANGWPKLTRLSLHGMDLCERDLSRALRQCVALEHTD
jgi:hypothetical protein